VGTEGTATAAGSIVINENQTTIGRAI